MDASPRPPKLLDRVRHEARLRHLARRTEDAYADWVRRFIRFHNIRHPKEMSTPEVRAFLTHLAVDRQVSASTHGEEGHFLPPASRVWVVGRRRGRK